VFAPDKPFQPTLMFVGKARAYPFEEPFKCSTPRVGSWPCPGTTGLAGKGCQVQTL
jgi:hypothetical protein